MFEFGSLNYLPAADVAVLGIAATDCVADTIFIEDELVDATGFLPFTFC